MLPSVDRWLYNVVRTLTWEWDNPNGRKGTLRVSRHLVNPAATAEQNLQLLLPLLSTKERAQVAKILYEWPELGDRFDRLHEILRGKAQVSPAASVQVDAPNDDADGEALPKRKKMRHQTTMNDVNLANFPVRAYPPPPRLSRIELQAQLKMNGGRVRNGETFGGFCQLTQRYARFVPEGNRMRRVHACPENNYQRIMCFVDRIIHEVLSRIDPQKPPGPGQRIRARAPWPRG